MACCQSSHPALAVAQEAAAHSTQRRPHRIVASARPLSSALTRPSRLPIKALPGLGFNTQRSRRSAASRAIFDPLSIDAAVYASTHVASATQNFLMTLADATDVTAAAAAVTEAAKDDGGWFGGLANGLEVVLKFLEQGLASLHVPYAYGFSIILLTVLVKAATYPLTKKQVESTIAMQSLAPRLKTIQTKFAGDTERVQLETARLYKQAGVNPLAGCLPTLATLPVWIGLYQALSNVAKEGVLTEGFFWIPSLAGPASLAARDDGSGLSWLFNWVDGVPPLGWGQTAAYLVLPVLLVASQYYSMQILQPQQMSDDPAQKNTQLILKFLPIMIGWFALSVPSGLSLYWFTNNVLSTAQTVYLRQMGGASPVITSDKVAEIIDVGQAKRTGDVATQDDAEKARAERFMKRKAEEAAKKAAKRAAEDAARLAAAQAARERAQLQEQQNPSAAVATEASDPVEAAVEVVQPSKVIEEDETEFSPAVTAEVGATAVNGSVRPASRRSKRTRKVR